jgi:hypothetical protein
LLRHVVYYMPKPVDFSALNVASVVVSVASQPIIALVEATLSSWIRAQFTSSWTHAVSVQAYYSNLDPSAVYSIDYVYPVPLVFNYVAGTWNVNVSRSLPGIAAAWQAGRTPAKIYLYFNVTDTFGNYFLASEVPMMPCVELVIVDRIAPKLNVDAVNALASGPALLPKTTYELKVTVAAEPGASFTRTVVMYYGTQQPTSNTVSAWVAAGASTLKFSLISASSGEWMAVLPPQAAGTELYWAIFAADYAGNDNAGNLTVGGSMIVYQTSIEDTLEAPVGYALIGVLAFGLVFAISYRIQQGVQSVKKAKKVSAAVKKAAPGKTIGGTSSSKQPISKDITTKECPICKAKIGADLSECPYCHKKF